MGSFFNVWQVGWLKRIRGSMLMKRRKGSVALVVAAQAVTALLFIAFGLSAQQAIQSQAAKQDEPRKVAESAPPVQPIPYSHKTHLALRGLECKNCHTNPDPGHMMTFPATSKCMVCHVKMAKAIRKLTEFAKSQQPIPWVRVYAVPSFVRWNHGTHLEAGIKCEVCHGQVAQMDVTVEATIVTSMFGCIDCHEKNNTRTGCDTCHN